MYACMCVYIGYATVTCPVQRWRKGNVGQGNRQKAAREKKIGKKWGKDIVKQPPPTMLCIPLSLGVASIQSPTRAPKATTESDTDTP